MFHTQPFGTVGVGGARTFCAEPVGAVLLAETLSTNLLGVAGWIRAGQLRFVLPAVSAYFYRIACTARSHTLSI